ncbi:hypothetical protein C7S13_3782 [Burkholderia cepacia]|nr:hypothetical protein [Burkholderia cepacia]
MRRALRDATLRSLAVIEAALPEEDRFDQGRTAFDAGGFAMAGDAEARDACAAMEAVASDDGRARSARWMDFEKTSSRHCGDWSSRGVELHCTECCTVASSLKCCGTARRRQSGARE